MNPETERNQVEQNKGRARAELGDGRKPGGAGDTKPELNGNEAEKNEEKKKRREDEPPGCIGKSLLHRLAPQFWGLADDSVVSPRFTRSGLYSSQENELGAALLEQA